MAIRDLAQGLGRGMDGELELVTPALVRRAADPSNAFLAEEAVNAMQAVISSCSPARVLAALVKQCGQRHAVARGRASVLMAMVRSGAEAY